MATLRAWCLRRGRLDSCCTSPPKKPTQLFRVSADHSSEDMEEKVWERPL